MQFRNKAAKTIKESGLFDSLWYLATYPDVAAAGLDPLKHFLLSGAAEGRNPSPNFNTIWYLSENYEIAANQINPLLHYIEHGRAAGLSPVPMSDDQQFESFDRAIRAGLLSGTHFHQNIEQIHYNIPAETQRGSSQDLPFPPLELSVRIGSPSLEGFDIIGREAKKTIVRCLPDGFSFDGARCLDFGCGIGRVIRHFGQEAGMSEFWGCDIDSTSILWCMKNLAPPFRFFQLSGAPVLPFESSSFELVYAVGVFSQVFHDWNVWAMEIRRVLKPGGTFFMTYNGQTPFEEMFSISYESYMQKTGMFVRNPYQSWNKGGPTVVLSAEWLNKVWGSMFDIEFIALEGLMDYQSICLMRKPVKGARVKSNAPTFALSTSQSFNVDALGKIGLRHDESRPFLESYGIQCSSQFDADGWIVFRKDKPKTLDAFVDGQPIASTVEFSPGESYRDWDAAQYRFVASCDAGSIEPGLHRLELKLQSQNGTSHTLTVPLTVR